MKQSRLALAKAEICAHFEGSTKAVFTLADLDGFLTSGRVTWRLPASLNVRRFSEFLVVETKLAAHRFEFSYRPTTRYLWGDVNPYELLMSLRPAGYLSHATAARYHGLLDASDAAVYYVNSEQEPKPKGSSKLEQGRIDAAFQRPPRLTNNHAPWGASTVCLLNGMSTGNLGVVTEALPGGIPVHVTGSERTLIDLAVRPFYSEGVEAVLEAYRRAAGRVSGELLAAMLKELDYIYPYYQAIGFYLEASGRHDPAVVKPFVKMKKRFDFYLTHQMSEMEYSEKWRVYYPKHLPVG